MNYFNQYNLLIERAKGRSLTCYKETHHIVPKCLGGSNDASNLVNLTAREHYIAHIFLAKMYGGTLWHAVNLMGRLKKYSNRQYEQAKIEHSKLLSEQNRKTKSKPKEVRHYTCSECNGFVQFIEFCHHDSKPHYFCNATCRNRFSAKHRKPQKGIPNIKLQGRPAWNKGVPNSNAARNGKKGAVKMAATATGRKRLYKEDGTWTWQYP